MVQAKLFYSKRAATAQQQQHYLKVFLLMNFYVFVVNKSQQNWQFNITKEDEMWAKKSK